MYYLISYLQTKALCSIDTVLEQSTNRPTVPVRGPVNRRSQSEWILCSTKYSMFLLRSPYRSFIATTAR
jgi:hypothetical protein